MLQSVPIPRKGGWTPASDCPGDELVPTLLRGGERVEVTVEREEAP